MYMYIMPVRKCTCAPMYVHVHVCFPSSTHKHVHVSGNPKCPKNRSNVISREIVAHSIPYGSHDTAGTAMADHSVAIPWPHHSLQEREQVSNNLVDPLDSWCTSFSRNSNIISTPKFNHPFEHHRIITQTPINAR